ncbi:hypothetical protein GC197_08525 [bacterium]|nr:hypothetical protein [bacterium]
MKNDFSQPEFNQSLVDLVHQIVHDELSPEEHAELEQMLQSDPAARSQYFLLLDLEYGLEKIATERNEASSEKRPIHAGTLATDPTRKRSSVGVWPLIALTLAAVIAVPLAIWGLNKGTVDQAKQSHDTSPTTCPEDSDPEMRIVQMARSRFFDEPQVFAPGDCLQVDHDYALVEGSIQLKSRTGAEMIVQAPAVFSIQSAEQVLLKVGTCSIYAPDGAEGFRVLTPQAEVVDKGTRFSIEVNESGEADVEVIEGAAEVFPRETSESGISNGLRLEAGQGRVINSLGQIASDDRADFGRTYQSTLPDRIISFKATAKKDPNPDQLLSVTAQRGGLPYTYDVDQLIGFDVLHFKVGKNINNITTPIMSIDPKQGDDSRRRVGYLDRDQSLLTGLLNPGGQETPLDSDPDITSEDLDARTQGMAIRFHQPVINGPGPDIVFFDLHVVHHPEAGDPFHVSPLHFEPGLKSHTVWNYDISLADRGAHALSDFRLYGFDRSIRSVEELCHANHNGGIPHAVPAKVIAAGIDLSDLGYPEGAEVRELFFQDAMDDENLIDPVFIGGFPSPRPAPATNQPTSDPE